MAFSALSSLEAAGDNLVNSPKEMVGNSIEERRYEYLYKMVVVEVVVVVPRTREELKMPQV